jgi:glycosyltransferase involved in cell wall biosynthesis
MRIGFVGNMNNGNFAIMRYFRDLGYDAYLLLYSNDGKNGSSHFIPEADTWDIEKWRPFIIQTEVADDPISIFGTPLSNLLGLRAWLRSCLISRKTKHIHPVSVKTIKNTFEGFSHLIGSGTSPSFLDRADLKLAIFFPYSMGVEWLGEPIFLRRLNSRNFITRWVMKAIIQKQTKAIRNTSIIICLDTSITYDTFHRINVPTRSLLCPMVYNNESIPDTTSNQMINDILDTLGRSDFSVLSHARHLWVQKKGVSAEEWKNQDKNNDWLIRSFAKLVNTGIVLKPLLVLFEYGEDVEQSKELCKILNIEQYITWLPKLDRKYIMLILSKVDVGVGEFYELSNMLFGGTGYEVLASGKPLIQGFDIHEKTFEQTYHIPCPPLLAVKTAEDVFNHLKLMASDSEKRKSLSEQSRIWFDRYCGIGLAQKWADLLNEKPNSRDSKK